MCVDNPTDYSCNVYPDAASCSFDIWNIGGSGVGTEICGTDFSEASVGYAIPQESCRCEWDSVEEECLFAYEVKSFFCAYDEMPDQFKCLKDFDVGSCVSGKQAFSWTATQKSVSGTLFSGGIPESVLQSSQCQPGDATKACGVETIKTPGFSRLALCTTLAILGLLYLRAFCKTSQE